MLCRELIQKEYKETKGKIHNIQKPDFLRLKEKVCEVLRKASGCD